MYCAMEKGHREIAGLFPSAGADASAQETDFGHTALFDADADIDAHNDQGGNTAMGVAVMYGPHIEVVRILLEAGADTHAENEQGETILAMARKRDAAEVVELLEEAGVSR